MSSGKFVCDLRTDSRLRSYLLFGGIVAWASGLLLLLTMPLPLALRLSLCVIWTVSSAVEWHHQRRGMARIGRIRICADGRVDGVAPGGARQPLTILPGSVVLERTAWLRLRFADGSRSGEWLRQRRGEAEQWRVLRVIWRQRSGYLGRSQGS